MSIYARVCVYMYIYTDSKGYIPRFSRRKQGSCSPLLATLKHLTSGRFQQRGSLKGSAASYAPVLLTQQAPKQDSRLSKDVCRSLCAYVCISTYVYIHTYIYMCYPPTGTHILYDFITKKDVSCCFCSRCETSPS